MRLSQHAVASLPLMAGVYFSTNSFASAIVAGLASVFIDLDHVSDYVLYRKGWGGVRDFFESCHEGRLTKLYLLLHAWEWPLLFLLLYMSLGAPQWTFMVALGMAYHLAFDVVGNRRIVKPRFYFITHRLGKGFEGALLYRNPTKAQLAALKRRSQG